ncbi:MAG TPA: hypothetical protein VFW82_07110 [Dyella sp.]|nr:hypothetical protein [Dyella sp.]
MPRALALAATVIIHLLWLLTLTRPAAPEPQRPHAPLAWSGALRLRWIAASAVAPIQRAPEVSPAVDQAARPARPRPDHQHERAPAERARPATAATPSTAMDLQLRPAAPSSPDYIAGGRALSAQLARGAPRPRVPGQASAAHAPVFRMADPRMQGIAGVVHFIGSLTGAVDPRCIGLDRARHLSLAERAARHITDADMAEAEYAHHCMPPPSAVGPGARLQSR